MFEETTQFEVYHIVPFSNEPGTYYTLHREIGPGELGPVIQVNDSRDRLREIVHNLTHAVHDVVIIG